VDPVPDPLLLRKSGSTGNRTQDLWICSQTLTTRQQRRSCKEIIAAKSKEVKTGCNLAESSKEGYGSERAVLLMMVMMKYVY
jgi:hypothetical protein